MGEGAVEGASCQSHHVSEQAYPTHRALKAKYLEKLKLCLKTLSARLAGRAEGRPFISRKLEVLKAHIYGLIIFLSLGEARVDLRFGPEKLEGLGQEIEGVLLECHPSRGRSGPQTSQQDPSAVSGVLTPIAAVLGVSQGQTSATSPGTSRGAPVFSPESDSVFPCMSPDSTNVAVSQAQGAYAQPQQTVPAHLAATTDPSSIRNAAITALNILREHPGTSQQPGTPVIRDAALFALQIWSELLEDEAVDVDVMAQLLQNQSSSDARGQGTEVS